MKYILLHILINMGANMTNFVEDDNLKLDSGKL